MTSQHSQGLEMDTAEEQLRSAVEEMQSDLQTCLTLVTRVYEENQRLRCCLEQILERPAQTQKEHNKRFVLKMPKIFKNRKLSTSSSESAESASALSQSSCQRCELQALEHRQTMSEMEAFYKDKLTESRSALKEKEEQLNSFKDRVAENMVLPSMTQSRLTEMYQQLRVCTWPNIHYTSADKQPRITVQEAFAAAASHMKTLKTSIKKLCDFRASPTVEKFTLTALENIQLALYHSSKQDVFKAAFPQFGGGPAELQLASECYWLGCLMELHSPPLHPHWDSADEKAFPRNIIRQTS